MYNFFATPWTLTCQAPLSTGLSQQECWSGLPFPFPGDLLNPGVEPTSPSAPALAGRLFTTTPLFLPGESHGQRSLAGYSPWGHKESDTTEQLHFHFYALEKEMATHSSVLAWRVPWAEEPGGLQSMGSQGV